jgi:hypothetical protein
VPGLENSQTEKTTPDPHHCLKFCDKNVRNWNSSIKKKENRIRTSLELLWTTLCFFVMSCDTFVTLEGTGSVSELPEVNDF